MSQALTADWIINNVNLATMQDTSDLPYGSIFDATIVLKNGKILWLGESSAAPTYHCENIFNGQNAWITPGLIDCHTHLIYAGNRANEFAWRLQGKSYEDIAKNGGGILNTVRATRNASEHDLYQSASGRLQQFMAEGVTTIEIKSGYGLDLETEIRMLNVAKKLHNNHPINVISSYLGAHAIPPEFSNKSDDYVNYICETVLPTIAKKKLANAVDVFCEKIGFNTTQCRKIFDTASELGLAVKAHAEQLSHSGGTKLVAEYSGLSADHIEYLTDSDIKQMKVKNVVAVLLPAAYYFLNEKQKPPIAALRNAKIDIAVASDCNPGSAPIASLLTPMNQACVLFALTPEEALIGVTRSAARALDLQINKGQLKVNMDADLALWEIEHPDELSYGINMIKPKHKWVNGNHV